MTGTSISGGGSDRGECAAAQGRLPFRERHALRWWLVQEAVKHNVRIELFLAAVGV